MAWHQWPRPPALDGERWFKVALATLLRGHVEAQGGSAEAWEQAVARFVLYHPAGRWPERKISNPVAAALPGTALPGEIALLEALAAVEGPEARWARLYDDELAAEAKLADPVQLGPAYDPRTTLGPGADWDTLAAWGAGTERAFADAALRAVDATWVLVEGRPSRLPGPSVLSALEEELPEGRVVRIPNAAVDDAVAEVEPSLVSLIEAGRNLVLVGEESGVAWILRVLARNLAVRDRTLAVVSVGGVIRGRTDELGPMSAAACADWLGAWFVQRALETEVVRLTPYFSVQWLDRAVWPPGIAGLPLQGARFPEPGAEGATAITTEVVDLGPLPVDPELPTALVARALIAVVCGWIVSRR